MKTIYELDLHELTNEIKDVDDGEKAYLQILRVPGGWLYFLADSSGVFVPMNCEYKPAEDNEP